MRKYKSAPLFFAAGTGANFLKNTNFLYLFAAWNVFAFIGYQWYVKKKVKDKETWNQMSSSQKYLSFIFKPEEKVTVVKFKGLHHVDTKSMDGATYLNPKLYPGEPEDNASSKLDSDE